LRLARLTAGKLSESAETTICTLSASIASYSATSTTRIILHPLTSDIATSLDHAIADKQEGGDCDDEMKLHFLTGELWHKEDRMIMKEFKDKKSNG